MRCSLSLSKTIIFIISTSLSTILFPSSILFADDVALGFDVQSFRPTPSPRDLVIVAQTEAISHLSLATGLFFSFSLDPLVLINQSTGKKVADVVKNRVELDIMAAFGITRWFEVGVIFPVILYQQGDNLHDLGREASVSPTKPGDFSMITKFPLVHRKVPDEGFGLALSLRTNFPTGSIEDFTSDGAFTFNPTVNLDYRFSKVGILLAGNFGVYFRPTVILSQVDGPRLGPMFTGQVGIEVPLIRNYGIGAIAGAYVNVPLTTTIQAGKGCVPAEALTGLRWYSTDLRTTFTSGFNFGIDCGLGVPTLRYWLSAIFLPPIKKDQDEQKRINFFKDGKCPTERFLREDQAYFLQCPLVIRKGNKIISLKGLQFVYDEPALDPKSFIQLDQMLVEVKKALSERSDAMIIIEGHTDPRGGYDYNIKLSKDRAEAVKGYLVQHGIPADRLTSIGYGYTAPLSLEELPDRTLASQCNYAQILLSSNSKEELKQHPSCDTLFYLNRRVELLITNKTELSRSTPMKEPAIVSPERSKQTTSQPTKRTNGRVPPKG